MLSLLSFANKLQHLAAADNHRRLVRLQGEPDWCLSQAQLLVKQLSQPYFWCGTAPDTICSTSFKQILGRETSLLIINALDHFDANAFAACEGTLRGGGLLILLCPTTIGSDDLFYQYINSQLSEHNFITIRQDHPFPALGSDISDRKINNPLNLVQQRTAVKAAIKTVTGHRRRPLVLTANRGRGKSASLGIAAAELLKSGSKRILVCAPNKQATATLFKHAGIILTSSENNFFAIIEDDKSIEFIAPDSLLADRPKCDLLIIDEAAALPVPTLETLVKHYSRVVFATTQHGYEGSGRGFALRFQKRLNEIAPQWRQLHLDQPIRWADNDPVENFTLNSLCLTKSPCEKPLYNYKHSIQFNKLSALQLAADKMLLREVFSLLVLAHYQTKPSDLEKLLNDPSLHIFIIKQNEQLLAVTLINEEGGFDKQISAKIWQGTRRVQGNLIAQSLTFHCAFKEAACESYARIQRIAVHPDCQHQGLGKRFISSLINWAENSHYDHICASFGATADLLTFWQRQSFTVLRIGSTRDSSSGTHSVIVNLPLSAKGKTLHRAVQKQFQLQFPVQLSRHLQHIEAELVLGLLDEFSKTTSSYRQLLSYIEGNRPYEYVEQALIELLFNTPLHNLSKEQQSLAVQKILQNNSWSEVCKKHNYSGKKQAQVQLKETIKQLQLRAIP
ncbi:tRNA(Met) cytidine acetyltransferase TmcA [Psychromonas ossibalaenae]|uniref:tRNA(Met) cytidine acetyltransferase TmcA n=1 Tax=Psychromonas ossibalaenae TaxID=444922 RepID=UPI000372B9D9|nr:GNAT family N-acetyltransferase [Psychromonas ossibalaenae]